MRERPNWRAALWLRRHRIRGKRKFIWTIVVLRLALPAAARSDQKPPGENGFSPPLSKRG